MVTLTRMYRYTLSGAVKGRIQRITGKIILQVEVICESRSGIPSGEWRESHRTWRDATPDDCMTRMEVR